MKDFLEGVPYELLELLGSNKKNIKIIPPITGREIKSIQKPDLPVS